YKAIHGGDSSDPGDFSGFAKHRELDSLELGRSDIDWEDRNQEKFAESYSEVFLENYTNRSSTGNFETQEQIDAFFEWVKEEVHSHFSGDENADNHTIMYADEEL